MATNVDRHLLFGLLALQNGLIDQGQLVAAFHAWTRDKDRPLAEHLVALGHLEPLHRPLIEGLAAAHLAHHEGDAEKSLAAIPSGRSTCESLSQIGDPDLGNTLPRISSSSTPNVDEPDRNATCSFGAITSDGQRFQVLRPYAQGGLGAVFVALDCELRREVALKQILDEHADDPVSRQRFLLEAEVTGGLEHPGIVPVYGLGTYDGGRPYYAMRFIKGDSLKEAIERFHQPREKSPSRPVEEGREGGVGQNPAGSRELELRKLLRRFTDVCNTIEYAHSRGILHRDIKPSNVILGKHGETLVVDWGLAKQLGQVEPRLEEGERMLIPSSASGSADTLPGSALGTPAYMSPEQARGEIDQLGPRSDVYSLGATLYCLLTGKPPVEGNDIGAILRAVEKAEFPPPRRCDPTIDKALESVCLKAMALQPEHRYPTPRALAEDVERWMADEPVAAYRERRLERLGRWFRQHRTWTYAAVATLILVCLVATIAVAVIEGSRQSEAEARREAERNFSMAQKAVDDYLTSVSENTLLKEQDSVDVRNLRQELLQSALKYYQQFVDQRSQDPRLRQELANAHFRVGMITKEISTPRQAIESFRSAETIWDQLAANEAEDDELQSHRAACRFEIGKLEESIGELESALHSLSQAQVILEPLAAKQPQVAIFQANLADCLAEIGVIRAKLDSTDEALVMLQKAKVIRQQLIERFPNDIGYQRSRAEGINELGYVFYKRLDYPAALLAFQDVRDICHTLLEKIPYGRKPAEILNWLALSYSNMAWIQSTLGQKEEALRSFELSLRHRSELVAAHPSVTRFHFKLGITYREFAELLHAVHQDDKAITSVQQSIDVFERLVQSHPEQETYHGELGLSWNFLGVLHDAARDNVKAMPAFRRAVAEQERAVAAAKEGSAYRGYLSNHLENLGEMYVDLGQVDEGLPHYLRALRIRKELHLARPENREYALYLSEALSTIGAIQRHAGHGGAARASLIQARELLEQLAAAHPRDVAISGRLGMALTREAVALTEEQKLAAALLVLARALELLTPLGSAAKADQEDRERLSEALWQVARVDRAIGKSADAVPIEDQRKALWKGRPAAELAALALKEATRSTLIGHGKTPIPELAKPARDRDRDLAAADLRLAISQGFTDLAMIRAHPDSAVLLERDDVKLLIKGLEARDKPSQRQPKK